MYHFFLMHIDANRCAYLHIFSNISAYICEYSHLRDYAHYPHHSAFAATAWPSLVTMCHYWLVTFLLTQPTLQFSQKTLRSATTALMQRRVDHTSSATNKCKHFRIQERSHQSCRPYLRGRNIVDQEHLCAHGLFSGQWVLSNGRVGQSSIC